RAWVAANQKERPIGDNRVAEAFSWRVTDLLKPDGCAGLILHATSLYNLKSKKYRQQFFQKHEILRMTNFSNLRHLLFGKKANAPAVTIVYRRASEVREKPPI